MRQIVSILSKGASKAFRNIAFAIELLLFGKDVILYALVLFFQLLWYYLRIFFSTITDFLPPITTVIAVAASVLHNYWASDWTMVRPFILNPTREIYYETHIYFIGDRVSLCFYALALILLCFRRWSTLLKMYLPIFKILLALEAATLVDYYFSGNDDILKVQGFDTNTIKVIIYVLYVGFYFMKRLIEKINYAEHQ